jgi:hypothetical protein
MVTTHPHTTEIPAKTEIVPVQSPVQTLAGREPEQPGLTTSSNFTASPDTTLGQVALSTEHFILFEPSATAARGPGSRPATESALDTTVTQEAKPYIAGMRHLVQGLEGIIVEYVNQSQVKVDELKIEIKHLIRGKKRKPLLWVTATVDPRVHPNQALALWDAIGTGIDQWRRRLPALERRLLQEQISVSVNWIEPDASSAR